MVMKNSEKIVFAEISEHILNSNLERMNYVCILKLHLFSKILVSHFQYILFCTLCKSSFLNVQ